MKKKYYIATGTYDAREDASIPNNYQAEIRIKEDGEGIDESVFWVMASTKKECKQRAARFCNVLNLICI